MKNFRDDEFQCKCGCGLDIDQDFKMVVIKARKLANVQFIIKSGARCVEHNYRVKGKPNSSHLDGLAVDIQCTNSRTRSIIMTAFCKVGVDRIGIAEDFLHFDIDPSKAPDVTWLY